ncbi:hypothetical protein CMUS01_01978 [Colletotrichum musicola]|uniref:Uncharacterized protein n=1 Tax=Colletotrichum musicola TaxID=2175873 RepID=A0A8H6U884_9PEZI|nr:hypothetical protein CMUS01_01978 [Colletotrichum musicola]
MWTRIIAWDEKWFYVATHFVRAGAGCPGQSSLYPDQAPRVGSKPFKADKDLYATALGRCVFKSGRKTVSPGNMLHMAGLVPDEVGKTAGLDEGVRDELRDVEENRQRGLKIAENKQAAPARPRDRVRQRRGRGFRETHGWDRRSWRGSHATATGRAAEETVPVVDPMIFNNPNYIHMARSKHSRSVGVHLAPGVSLSAVVHSDRCVSSLP